VLLKQSAFVLVMPVCSNRLHFLFLLEMSASMNKNTAYVSRSNVQMSKEMRPV